MSHVYTHPDGRKVEHPGRRSNCSICLCDPRYGRQLRMPRLGTAIMHYSDGTPVFVNIR